MSTPSEPPFNPYEAPRADVDLDPALPAAEEVRHSPRGPLIAAAITSALVTAASYLAPERYAATAVGVLFLAAAWWLVLRHDEVTVRAYGLSLGGLLEPARLDPARIAR